jgi:hypothetical protein
LANVKTPIAKVAAPVTRTGRNHGARAAWVACTSPSASAAASGANSMPGRNANSVLPMTMNGSARMLQRSSLASRR